LIISRPGAATIATVRPYLSFSTVQANFDLLFVAIEDGDGVPVGDGDDTGGVGFGGVSTEREKEEKSRCGEYFFHIPHGLYSRTRTFLPFLLQAL
jgi:hypothetical protein